MFFFCTFARADSSALATDLFQKKEWVLCRRECQRALLEHKQPGERLQLMDALCATRSGLAAAKAANLLEPLATSTNTQVAAIAAYDLGRLQWELNQSEKAADSLAFAFVHATDKDLFLHAACSLFLLFDDHHELRKGREDLVMQINTSRAEWYGALFAQCGKPGPAAREPAPPSWAIRFYRDEISPAIGNRCVLEPSCSEYFRRARAKHGTLKTLPMIADRLVREPGVSNAKKNPVVMLDGQIRYRDPIKNHDFWMKK